MFLSCSLAVFTDRTVEAGEAQAVPAGQRIVILAPAAADVLYRLEAGGQVVGVTSQVVEFPSAAKVGTHRNPGIESIAALRPTLIIAPARFDQELATRMGAKIFVYEPKSLEGIVEAASGLADLTGQTERGRELVAYLRDLATQIVPLENPPSALYEVRSNPLSVAAGESIVIDLLERAGFRYPHQGSSGAISAEYLLTRQPDYYIYQDGPMNRNPQPPLERHGWSELKSCVWRVDELEFARPNVRLFEKALELNQILRAENPCAEGMKVFR